ncbi:MAG: hypothetical protein UR73_C0030G0001 [candidate division WS6 bacterium GW2011_GWF1_35_23]|uniref:ABC transporter domain-containing protein n=1 Tax=candidate division WS6 bacterium GW2011_GWF1_35_23 TaxID=1619097 RepID=A0A0G0CIM1_9BACT|nr:MAG: hypothetical protein UR73_C0030G0001 [candidate division WS6 bacterium GW2011_GWF1_35_23]
MKEAVVSVKNLSKTFRIFKSKGISSLFSRKYEDIKAVEDISFDVYKEEFVGFIGQNGAGKTTTLKCLTGLLTPDSGEVEVLGYDPKRRKHEFLSNIALVMGNKSQLWWELPAIETFKLNKEIYEVSDARFEEIVLEMVELLGIEEVVNIPVRKLSLGERMKCEIVASLIHTPELLFLDEPTLGLDVVSQQRLRDFLREYNKRYKASIILTSHNMEDIKDLCKRVIIIDKGKKIYDGKVDDLARNFVKSKEIVFSLSSVATHGEIEQVGKIIEFSGLSGIISVPRESVASASSKLLNTFQVEDLNIQEPSLEYIVKELFEGRYKV